MKRLTMLGAFAAMSALSGWAALSASVADKAAPPDAHHAMYASCARVCGDCLLSCEGMVHHCSELVAAGKKEHAKPMQLAADCGEFCALSAKLTARHSDLATTACEGCAKACDACAAECDKFKDMPEMKACIDQCRKCAASCREMTKHAGSHGEHK